MIPFSHKVLNISMRESTVVALLTFGSCTLGIRSLIIWQFVKVTQASIVKNFPPKFLVKPVSVAEYWMDSNFLAKSSLNLCHTCDK